MKFYIGGPMSGLPEYNFPAFYAAEAWLKELGFETHNPARFNPPNLTWEDYMRLDIPQLLQCTDIALLPGWRQSRGATLEVYIAERLSMGVYELPDLKLVVEHNPTIEGFFAGELLK